MLKKVFTMLGAVLLLASCAPKTGGSTQASASKNFGAQVDAKKALAYEALMPKMATVDSMPAKVKGKVNEVCQKKGCWMTLASDKPGVPEMRVTFKDYAFFMPKDLAGKHVVVDGYAYVETTTVEELRHYAQDAGKSKEEINAITQPKREVSFEAAGVLVTD
jgi:hypothetical protein